MANKKLLESVHILIADRDVHLARVLCHSLNVFGFQRLFQARNGQEALKLLHHQRIDLLITEWAMHPMDGLDLVRHIRRHPDSPNRGLPVIMLTGKGEKPDVEAARDCGVTEFVVKPFTPLTLFNRIEQVIDHPRPVLVSLDFVGPDRRRKGAAPGGEERRRCTLKSAASSSGTLPPPASEPLLFPPRDLLQRGKGTPFRYRRSSRPECWTRRSARSRHYRMSRGSGFVRTCPGWKKPMTYLPVSHTPRQ
jgi:CheY-like chemotaxis protein